MNKHKGIRNTVLGLLAATLIYSTPFAGMPKANADEFPEKGQFAVSGDAKFTTNRKAEISGSGDKITLKSSEYSGNIAYGLTEGIAPYAKIGVTNLKVNAEGVDLQCGNRPLWGAGVMTRISGLPANLEARLKAGYESVSGLKASTTIDGVTVDAESSMHKIPVEATLYKDFGKLGLEGGVAYENLSGKAKLAAMGYEETSKFKGLNNFGAIARLTAKPTKNTAISVYYNSIGNAFGGKATIKF